MRKLTVRERARRHANYVIWYNESVIWYAVSLQEAYRKMREMSTILGYGPWSKYVHMMELD